MNFAVWIAGGLAMAVLVGLLQAVVPVWLDRRAPRLMRWWRGPYAEVLRLSLLLTFFLGCAVGFGLLGSGVLFPDVGVNAVLGIAVIAAVMAIWVCAHLVRLYVGKRRRQGYAPDRRSSDGSWSAGGRFPRRGGAAD